MRASGGGRWHQGGLPARDGGGRHCKKTCDQCAPDRGWASSACVLWRRCLEESTYACAGSFTPPHPPSSSRMMLRVCVTPYQAAIRGLPPAAILCRSLEQASRVVAPLHWTLIGAGLFALRDHGSLSLMISNTFALCVAWQLSAIRIRTSSHISSEGSRIMTPHLFNPQKGEKGKRRNLTEKSGGMHADKRKKDVCSVCTLCMHMHVRLFLHSILII